MAHKTKVNGTNYEISGGKTRINGTNYSISKGKTLVGGATYDVEFGIPKNFADASWEQIIFACQNNIVPDTWKVGDQKTMRINYSNSNVIIIGKNHDTYVDGSTAPLTFQTKQTVSGGSCKIREDYSNEGGYDSTIVFNTKMPSIFATLPSEVKSAIKLVNKKSSIGNTSSTIETIACDLFPLSEVEVFGNTTYSAQGEGKQYEYYSNGGMKGKGYKCWLRSPALKNERSWCVVTTSNTIETENIGNTAYIAPAFCF